MENFGCGAPESLTTEQLRQEISDLQFDVSEARDHLDMLVQIKTQLEYVNMYNRTKITIQIVQNA